MEVLRDNRESLMAVLEAFVYDPLIAWRLTATNQPGGRVNAEQDVDEAVARQRKSKANETEILNGKCGVRQVHGLGADRLQTPSEQR
jgi:FKBP12-rapamycin complex-associated protein